MNDLPILHLGTPVLRLQAKEVQEPDDDGVREVVERPAEVLIEAMDPEGGYLRLEAGGELARCLQHEIDHLDGVLYIDHLSPLARQILLKRYHKLQDPWGSA